MAGHVLFSEFLFSTTTSQRDENAENTADNASPLRSATSSITAPLYKNIHDYKMDHPNRGRCVVFSHEHFLDERLKQRRGTQCDEERIRKTFIRLNFIVDVYRDCDHDAIMDKIQEISEEDHSSNDCVCIIVLTHGEDNNTIHARNTTYKIEDLWKPFTANQCLTLADKPKLFFFSACRGVKQDMGVALFTDDRTETDGAHPSYLIPTEADFLFGFSTPPGYVSHREPTDGTWYIKSLCAVLDKHAPANELLDILTRTTNEVTRRCSSTNPQRKQVPEFHSRLSRRVFFTPK